MEQAILVCTLAKQVPILEGYDYIGVDYGAYVCAKQQIHMKIAIGDFDSVSKEQLEQIKQYSDEIITLPTHKDETDSEKAILYALKHYKQLILYGGLQGRIDHTMANLYLLMHRDYPLALMDEQNYMIVLHEGIHTIKNQYKYMSVLALSPSCISLKQVAYPLEHKEIKVDDVYTISNEIVGEEAIVEVHEGKILLMLCNDQK